MLHKGTQDEEASESRENARAGRCNLWLGAEEKHLQGHGGHTWVHLTVVGHSVRVHNVLEPGCEGVEGEKGGWRRGGGQAVVERVDPAATFPLIKQKQENDAKYETVIMEMLKVPWT